MLSNKTNTTYHDMHALLVAQSECELSETPILHIDDVPFVSSYDNVADQYNGCDTLYAVIERRQAILDGLDIPVTTTIIEDVPNLGLARIYERRLTQTSEYFKHEPEGQYAGFNPEGLKDSPVDMESFIKLTHPPEVIEELRAIAGQINNTNTNTNDWQANFMLASQIVMKQVTWLWDNRIPENSLSIFCGDADKGKGCVATDIVARLTTGRPMPNSSPNPFGKAVSVIVMGAEDSLDTVVGPRLKAAGANMDKVHILQSVSRKGAKSVETRQLSLKTDLNIIADRLKKFPDIKLVVVDPISNYLGDTKLNQETEMRPVLTLVRDMAEKVSVTFICVAHFNKNTGAAGVIG